MIIHPLRLTPDWFTVNFGVHDLTKVAFESYKAPYGSLLSLDIYI